YATGGNSKIDINVKENIDINTIGNSNSSIYGVLSFNESVAFPPEELLYIPYDAIVSFELKFKFPDEFNEI
ncbi:hypothetical protein H6A04_13120, partial [Fusobacterium mortiferum]|nr:hypothetical protein [Fusobacterium mortiferum]